MNLPKLATVDFDTVAPLMPANVVAGRVTARSPWEYTMPRQTAPEKLAMTGATRLPVYLPDHPAIRMVSQPNGLWRVERRITEHGTREVDNWIALSRDTTKENAGHILTALAGTRG